MVAVAVRRFHDDDVGAGGRFGISDDWQLPAADVAREHQASRHSTLRAIEHDGRRAKDVSRLDEGAADSRCDVERNIIWNADHPTHQSRDVALIVERWGERFLATRQELG